MSASAEYLRSQQGTVTNFDGVLETVATAFDIEDETDDDAEVPPVDETDGEEELPPATTRTAARRPPPGRRRRR
jgi:hypothetical protein